MGCRDFGGIPRFGRASSPDPASPIGRSESRCWTAPREGTERALTTVMYLLSLADLGSAPFALVDEINQGMDQRVERQVHNALVATTCKDDVGQCGFFLVSFLPLPEMLSTFFFRYFLITPKLPPNLDYHDRMKVLIINNVPCSRPSSFRWV